MPQPPAPQLNDNLFLKIDDFEARIRVLERQGYDETVGGPSGVAGGDLSGTYPNPKVVRAATNFTAGDNITSNSGEAGQVRLGARASGGEIAFGAPTDSYVYRKAAGVVGVDNYLDANLGLRISGSALASTHLSDSSDIARFSTIGAQQNVFTGAGPLGPSVIAGPAGFVPSNSGQTAMLLRSGGTSTGNAQIAFGYDETNTYLHRINTRHNAGVQTGNAIDFYVWQRAVDTTVALGTQHVLTLDGTGSNITGGLKLNNGILDLGSASSVVWPTAGLLDLSPVAATATTTGSGVGDKIALYQASYGFGIQSNRLVAWVADTTRAFSVRAAAGAGNKSSGTDAVSLFGDGSIVGIGSGAIGQAAISANQRFVVNSTLTDAVSTQYGIRSLLSNAHAAAAAVGMYALSGEITITGTGNDTGIISAVTGQTTYNASGAGSNINAGQFLLVNSTLSGGISTGRGLYVRIDNNHATNPISNALGLVVAQNIGAGPIANNTGVQVQGLGGTGVITGLDIGAMSGAVTSVGLQIAEPTAGTTRRALSLYSTSGLASAGITFGGDTTLYRSAADVLRTDDTLQVGFGLSVGQGISTTDGQITAYRSTVGVGAFAAYITAGANPKWKVTPTAAGASLEWGDGTAALDTNLYRAQADLLKTDDNLWVQGTITDIGGIMVSKAAGTFGLNVSHTGDAQARMSLSVSGVMSWGDGTLAGGDTTLYRGAADVLRTDDQFQSVRTNATDSAFLAQSTVLGGFGTFLVRADGYMEWGPGSAVRDTALYRAVQHTLPGLETDDPIRVVRTGATNQHIQLTPGDAGGNYLDSWTAEQNKKHLYFRTIHGSEGAPAGGHGFDWQVGPASAPVTVATLSEAGAFNVAGASAGYSIGGVALKSTHLSDFALIAMLNENEIVTGGWTWQASQSYAPAGTTSPRMTLTMGTAANPAYFAWFNAANARKAYIGWGSDTTLDMQVEAGAKFSFSSLALATSAVENATASFQSGAHTFLSNIATQRMVYLSAPTYAGDALGRTITNAATLAITGAPVAGTNMTLSNSYALWAQAGMTRLDGGLNVNAGATLSGGTVVNQTAAGVVGLDVNGFANNSAAIMRITGGASPNYAAFEIRNPTPSTTFDISYGGVLRWLSEPTLNLYRGQTGQLKTDAQVYINNTGGLGVNVAPDPAAMITLPSGTTMATTGIKWGSGAQFYSDTTNRLRFDSILYVPANVVSIGTVVSGNVGLRVGGTKLDDPAASSARYAVLIDQDWKPTTDIAKAYHGLNTSYSIDTSLAAGPLTSTQYANYANVAYTTGTQPLTGLYGGRFGVSTGAGVGTVATGFNLRISPSYLTPVTTHYGIYIDAPAASSVTGTAMGIYVESMVGVTAGTNRAIYVGGGNVRLGANLTTARTRVGFGIDPTVGQIQLTSSTVADDGIYFGTDVNLYRLAADILTTDDRLHITRVNAGDVSLSTRLAADTLNRFQAAADGTLSWGDGTGAVDTSLVRTTVSQLGLASGDMLDLGAAGGTGATTGSGLGDKLLLYSNTYGLGIQSNRMVAWVASTVGAFAVRIDNAAGQHSAGTDAWSVTGAGAVTQTQNSAGTGWALTQPGGGTIFTANRTDQTDLVRLTMIAGAPYASFFDVSDDGTNWIHGWGVDKSGRMYLGNWLSGSAPATLSFVAATTAVGGIDFGGDVSLYRSAANILRTDDLIQSTQAVTINTTDFNTYGWGQWQNAQGAVSVGSDATSAYIQSWNSRPLRLNSQGQLVYVGSGLSVAGGLAVTSGTVTLPVGSLNGSALMDGTLPISAFGFIFGGNNMLYNSGFEAAATVDADPNATYQPWDGWVVNNGTLAIVTKPQTELRSSVTLPQATIPIKDTANWTAPGVARMGATSFNYTGIAVDANGLATLTGGSLGTGTFAAGTPVTQDPQGVDANRVWGIGNNAVKWTATTSGAYSFVETSTARMVPVTPSLTYTFSGYMGANNAGKSAYVQITIFDSARVQLSSGGIVATNVQVLSTTGMTRLWKTTTMPATAKYVKIAAVVQNTSVVSGDIYYADAMMLSEGDTLFAYEPRSDENLPGSINATMIQAGAVTGDAFVANVSITGKRIQTAPSGQRVVLEGDSASTLGEAGVGVYNAAGNLRVRLGEVTGMTLFSTTGISDPVLKLADTGGLMVGSPTGARTIFDLNGVSTYDSVPTLRVRLDAASGLTLRDTSSNIQVQLSGTGGLQTIGSGGAVFFDSTGLSAYNSITTFTAAQQVIRIDRNTGMLTMGVPTLQRVEADRTSLRFYDSSGVLGLYTDFGGLRTSSTTTYASLTSTGLHMVTAGVERVLLDGTAGLTLKDNAGVARVVLSTDGGLKTTGATGTVILNDSGITGYNSPTTLDATTQTTRIDRVTGSLIIGPPSAAARIEADRTSMRFFQSDGVTVGLYARAGMVSTAASSAGARIDIDGATDTIGIYSSTQPRVTLDPTNGLRLHNTSGTPLVFLSATGGLTTQAAESAARVTLNSQGLISFDASNNQTALIDAATGRTVLGNPSGRKMEADRTSLRFYDDALVQQFSVINGVMTTGAADTGARVRIWSGGIAAYDASSVQRFLIDAAQGVITLRDTAAVARMQLSTTGGLKSLSATGGTVILDDTGVGGYTGQAMSAAEQTFKLDRATGLLTLGVPSPGRRMEADRTSFRYFNDSNLQTFSIINGVLTTGVADSGARVRMDNLGIKAYNVAGVNTVAINSDGTAYFSGAGGGNLLPNSSAEVFPGQYLGYQGTLAQELTEVKFGTSALKLTVTTAPAQFYQTLVPPAKTAARVEPGKTYTVSGWLKSAQASRNAYIMSRFSDAAGTILPGPTPNVWNYLTGVNTPLSTTAWTRLSVTGVAPPNARWCGITVMLTDGLVGEVFYADGFQVEEGEWATSYSADVASTLSEVSIDAGVITAGTFRGTTFETSANVNVSKVMFDAAGIRGYDAAAQSFNLATTGLLTLGNVSPGARMEADRTSFRYYNSSNLLQFSVINGVLTTAAATGARVELSSAGLKAYNAAAVNTVAINTDGSAYFRGQIDVSNSTYLGTVPASTLITPGSITFGLMGNTIGGGNLQTNSSFEHPTSYLTGWNFSSATGAAETVIVHQGGTSAKVTLTAANGYIYNSTSRPPVTESKTYIASAWVYLPVSATIRMYIYGYDAGAASLGSTTLNTVVPANVWTRVFSPPYLMPVGTVSARTNVYYVGGVGGEIFYVDDVQIEEGDTPTAYAPKVDEILPGTPIQTSSATINKVIFDIAGIRSYDGTSSSPVVNLATDGSLTLGTPTVAHVTVDRTSMRFYQSDGTTVGLYARAGIISTAATASGARVEMEGTGTVDKFAVYSSTQERVTLEGVQGLTLRDSSGIAKLYLSALGGLTTVAADTAQRVTLNGLGLLAYDTGGLQTVQIDSATGKIVVGNPAGQRMEATRTALGFYSSTNTLGLSLGASGGLTTQAAESAQRVTLSSAGLTSYNTSNQQTVLIDAATGKIIIGPPTGAARIEADRTSMIFYQASGTVPGMTVTAGKIVSDTSVGVARIEVDGVANQFAAYDTVRQRLGIDGTNGMRLWDAAGVLGLQSSAGGLVTGAGASRVEMLGDGITLYNAGQRSIKLDAALGEFIAGTEAVGQRIEIDLNGFRMYDDNNILGIHSINNGWSTALEPNGRVEMDSLGLRAIDPGGLKIFELFSDGVTPSYFRGALAADGGIIQPVTADGTVLDGNKYSWRDSTDYEVAYLGTAMAAGSDQYSSSVMATDIIRNYWRMDETGGLVLGDDVGLAPLGGLTGAYTLGSAGLQINELNPAVNFFGAGGRASSTLWYGFDALGTPAAALNARAGLYGGSWATSGSAGGDWATTTSDAFFGRAGAVRSAVNDSSGRIALLGTANWDDTKLTMQMAFEWLNTTGTLEMGFIARYVDALNYLKAVYRKTSAEATDKFRMDIVKVIGGNPTTIATRLSTSGWPLKTYNSSPPTLVINRYGTVTFTTNANAEYAIGATDVDLATGGVLASGKVGMWDMLTGAGAGTKKRIYYDFKAESPERNFQQATFTWEGWVKPTTVDATDRIIFEVAPSALTAASGWRITQSTAGVKLWYVSATTLWTQVAGLIGAPLVANTTALLAVHWGASSGGVNYQKYTIFENGVQSATVTDTAAKNPNGYTHPLGIVTLGASGTGTQPFLGTIDEVAYYNNTVSPIKIKQHYDIGVATGVADVELRAKVQSPGGVLHEIVILDQDGNSDLAPKAVQAKALCVNDFTVTCTIPGPTIMPFDTVEYESTPGTISLAPQGQPGAGEITFPEDGTYVCTAQWNVGSAVLAAPTTYVDAYFEYGGARRGEVRTTSNVTGMMVNVSAQFQATAGGKMVFKVGSNKGGTGANGAGSLGLPQYVAITKVGGPKGDPGKDGVNGTNGAKGDPGYFENVYINSSNGPTTSLATPVGSWAILPVTASAADFLTPVGAFTRNADGTVTVRDAGYYLIEADVYATPAWTTANIRMVTGINLDTPGETIARADSNSGPGGATAFPSTKLSGHAYIAAGQKVVVSYNGQTSSGTAVITTFSISRVGAGPTGPQGLQGNQGIKGDPGYYEYALESYTAQTFVSLTSVTWVRLALPVVNTQSTNANDSLRWNADGSVTMLQAGWYTLDCQIQLPAGTAGAGWQFGWWATTDDTTPVGGAAGALYKQEIPAPISSATAVVSMPYTGYFAANSRVGVSIYNRGATASGGLTRWSIARIGAGPAGAKGDVGPVGPASNTNVPVATILTTAVPKTGDYTSAPGGFLFCDGSPASRTTYAALFSAIGTTYGAGDGSTTFNLPDLLGRFALGAGTPGTPAVQGGSAHALGSKGGEEQHILTGPESGIAAHKHTISGSTGSGGAHGHTIQHGGSSATGPGAAGWIGPQANSGSYWGDVQGAADHTHAVGTLVNANAGPTNAVEDHQNMPPFTTVNYMIKY